MRKLVAVIGPAPHERTIPSLLELLKKERFRISDILSRAKAKPKRKAATGEKRVAKGKTRLSEQQLKLISEASGISIEDLKRGG